MYCLRLPYQSIALAAGKYKETRNGAFGEAFINVILSIIFVNFFGITGVAIGTCIAMAFRMILYVIFTSKNILNISLAYFIKRIIINACNVIFIVLISYALPLNTINTYTQWIINAFIIFMIAFFENMIVNVLFYYKDFNYILSFIKKLVRKNVRL